MEDHQYRGQITLGSETGFSGLALPPTSLVTVIEQI